MDPNLDPFSPTAAPQSDPANPANSNVASSWNQALGDPGVRTALLQFGISLMQPPSFGDTTSSQIGRAIGDSGEAVSRVNEDTRKQQETDSKASLRDAQSTAAEARATAAGARTDAAGSRLQVEQAKLGLAGERLSLAQILGRQRRQIDATNAYSRYLQTRSPLDTEPALTREEFYAKSGFGDLRDSGGSAGGGTSNAVDATAELARAKTAITNGANADQVRELYRSRTGQEAPF